ncbi:MAG: hypothetical protein A2583_06465 [Bdellovibrionales bacterium RIFOXYD1_FULL_53_11]|nr:MAG: hypothetical protein A2583_06465 [Bdellovibrionales bacterium RIFOXYD1_FULL_53_11]
MEKDWVKKFGLASVMMVDILGYSGAGVGIGYLAWNKLGWPWWVILLTSTAGLVLAMYRLYRMFIREMR